MSQLLNRGDARRLVGLILMSGLMAGGPGCGSGAPYAESSMTEATVTGRVTSQGKPVTTGQVVFDPSNINRRTETARTAEIQKDGTYQVTTLIGENRVTVAIPGRPKKKAGTPQPHVRQVFEVKTGSNSLDITAP